MNFGSSAIKLNNIQTYNSTSNAASNVFKKQFYSDYEDIDYNNYEEVNYENKIDIQKQIEEHKDDKEWWESLGDIADKVKDGCITFTTSLACGALELVENVGDGLMMAGGAIASGVVSIWDEDLAQDIKDSTSKVVAYDWTEKLYSETITALGVDEEIAYGGLHTAGNFIGTTAAYVAVSCVPGGALVTGSIGAVSALGSSSEQALNCGASFDEAFSVGAVAGIAGAVSGGALNKVGGLAGGAKTLGQVAKYSAMGAGVAMTEPMVNTTAQYLVYGQDMVDENGNKLYNGVEGYLDYYKDSGGLLNTAIAGLTGGGSTALKGFKGYRNFKSRMEYLTENDMSALLEDATDNDYYTKWSKRRISSWAHENFDNIFGYEEIEKMMEKVTKVKDDYWPKLLREHRLDETVKGFVDKKSNLYLPQSANEHAAFHELFHQLSEIQNKGTLAIDASGNGRKITGIRQFYADGFDSTWANETLTDYLASKYSDGKIYESIYGKSNVKLWNRLDDAMTEAYGLSGGNLLINSYITNDTSAIENFFQSYSKKSSYDDFVRSMGKFETNKLENIVTNIEKNVYKQNNSFVSKIKSLFGGG